MISVNCCSFFECDITTTEFGYKNNINATEVRPALEFDACDANRHVVYYIFIFTDSDIATNGNIVWKEM